jgi:hypothetical protein
VSQAKDLVDLAVSRLAAGDIAGAERLLNEARLASPEDPWVAYRLARLYGATDVEETVLRLRDVCRSFARFPPARIGLAEFLIRSGSLSEARLILTEVLAAQSDEKWALKFLADIQVFEGDEVGAFETLHRLRSSHPGFWPGYEGALKICERRAAIADAATILNAARLHCGADPAARGQIERFAVWLESNSDSLSTQGRGSPAAPLRPHDTLTVFSLKTATGRAALGPRLAGQMQALFEDLNRFEADRLLRSYQRRIYVSGRFEVDLSSLGGTFSFAGTVYLGVPKAYAWAFRGDRFTAWLVSRGIAGGFDITDIYIPDYKLVVSLHESPDGVSGTLSTVVAQIDQVAATSGHGNSRRVLLLVGHANYAHCIWNEYPALIELERYEMADAVKSVILCEQFAPIGRLFPRHAAAGALAELPVADGFSEDLLFSAGSVLVTDAVRNRLMQAISVEEKPVATNGDKLPDGSPCIVWLSIRAMYRRATNEVDAFYGIISLLDRLGLRCNVMLDGFSLTADLESGRYSVEQLRRWAAETSAVAGTLMDRCDRACFESVQVFDCTHLNLPESILKASSAHYYVCHHGTQQHKVGWLFDIPGIVHANVHVSRQSPAAWVQRQAGFRQCPTYVPARFIADDEDGGERRDLPYFRDYRFVDLDGLADFVVADLVEKLGLSPRGRTYATG